MTPGINGRIGPIFQGTEYEWDPINGERRFELWEAYPSSDLLGLMDSAKTAKIPHSLSEREGTGQLRIMVNSSEAGGGGENAEEPVDSWQVLGDEVSKSIFDHPGAIYFEHLSPGAMTRIKEIVADIKENGYTAAAVAVSISGDPLAVIDPDNNLAMRMIRLLLKDQDQYSEAHYVVRHSRTVSATYTGDTDDTFVGLIYTTAQLIAECTRSGLTTQIPTRLQSKINNIDGPSFLYSGSLLLPDRVSGYRWGWKKLPSSESTVAGNRVEITTDYVLDLWNVDFYYTQKPG